MPQYYSGKHGKKHTLLAVVVSTGVLGILMYKADIRFDRVVDQMRRMDWRVLALMFSFSAAWHIFVGADKWYRILRAMGAPTTYKEVLWVRLAADPIRFASPLKLGEIIYAAYFARFEAFGFSRAAGSIAFDKALNFFGTLFWLYIGMVSLMSVPQAGHLALHTVVGLGLLALLVVRPLRDVLRIIAGKVHPKIGRLATGVLAAFDEFSATRKVGFLLYGIVFQLRPLIVCYLIFIAARPEHMPTFQEFLTYGSVAVLMSNVPFTVAGLGPREAALMKLFSGYGSQTVLLSVGVLMSLSIQAIPALLGIPFMFPLLRSLSEQVVRPPAMPPIEAAGKPIAAPVEK